MRRLALTLLLLPALMSSAVAQEGRLAQEAVDESLQVFRAFVANPDMQWFRDNVGQSQGIMIVPQLGQGGFILGAKGGSGVLLRRDAATGEWSYPSFTGMGGVTFGLDLHRNPGAVFMYHIRQFSIARDMRVVVDTFHGVDLTVPGDKR